MTTIINAEMHTCTKLPHSLVFTIVLYTFISRQYLIVTHIIMEECVYSMRSVCKLYLGFPSKGGEHF